MLEKTSNFRINLDLFYLAIFGTNYGLQTADKATKVALRYFGPLPAKRRLEIIDNLAIIDSLQNGPNAKVQWIEIRRFW